jgi:hypothetical protein
MTTAPRAIGVGELALRAANRRGAWIVLLISDAKSVTTAAEELMAELEVMSEEPPVHVRDPGSPGAMAQAFAENPAGVLLVSGIDRFTGEDWAHVDLLRSQYQREPSVVLLMTMASMVLLMQHAPNLASWIGGTAWSWDRDAERLTQAQREQRLAALREWAGYDDEELVRRAERGELPSDPEYAEWLVLIRRGELIRNA